MIHRRTGRWKGPVHVGASVSTSFLYLQIGCSFATDVDVCADLARISVLYPSPLMVAPRYLNCLTLSNSCPLAVMRDLIVLLLFVIIFVFFCANFHSIYG